MSFGKKYFSSYKSNNGYDYYLEIWVFGQTDPAYEKRLGEGGPVIQYETDTEDRFSPILTSQCRIPFLVENVIESQFIDSLRTDFQERQIYVHIYRESQSGYASVAPLWSGFMLMDIGEGQDKSFPYVQELVFVDGLSLLKNIDFVDLSDPLSENNVQGNYVVKNMYFGPASYIFWFREILRKSGAALTSNGATQDYKISTSVNWYNGDMDSLGQSQDPLEKTKCVVSMFHTKDDQDVFYPENCYNVLKELLRHWGARITYWKHRFYIVQIPEYITAETGLIDAPININSRIYNESGSFSGSQNHTGSTFWTRYFQTISNTRISKLVGTKYNYLPILKQINANFLSFTGENKFGGFPFGPNATSQEVFQGTLNNPSNADFLFVSIPTNWAWDLSQASSSFSPTQGWWMQIKFNFYAVQDDGAGNLSYFYLQYRTSTGKYFWVDAANWSPLGATSPRYVVRSFNITETAYVGFEASIPFEDSSGNPITMDGAWSFFIDIEDYGTSGSNPGSFYLNNSGYGGVPQRMRNPNVRIQVPAGSGNFSGTISWSNTLQDPQGILVTSNTVNPAGFNAGTATDDIQFDTSSPFVGKLQLIKSGQSSSYGSTLNVYNNTTTTSQANSEIFDMGTLLWGDSVSYARSSLQVDNGTNFVNTNPNGLWGRGTLSGTKTFTQLLIDEFLSGQTKITISPTMRLGVGVANKNETGSATGGGTTTRPRYVNPIGKLRELRSNATDPEYFFRRGAFYTLLDEWDYEGYQIIRNTPTTTTQTNNMGNLGGSQVNAQASSAPLQNKISQSLAQNSPIAYLRQPVPSVGSNVAVNGNFTTASDWSLGTGWTIDTTESKAKFSATGSTSDLVQSVLEIEKTYQINFKVEVTSGTLSVKAGTTSSTVVVSTSGNYSLYVQCLGNTQIKFQAGTTFNGNITHITIKEQKTLTSLPINAIGSAVIKAGDTFNVINDNEDQIIKLTATANQGASDTSISVQSLPLFDDIVEESYILINQEDLAAQYQNKTKGTVGGFDITATSIDSGSVAISSYIDDDSFGTASATSLATSESIKAYVDTQVGSADTLQEVTDNGNTTTNSITIGNAASPNNALEVYGNADSGVARFRHTSNGAYGSILLGSVNLFIGDVGNYMFKNGSSELMRLTSDGNLLIGTTNNNGTRLQSISPNGNNLSLRLGRADNSNFWDFNHAGNDLRIYNEATSGSNILLGVDAGGNVEANNVGIGVANPTEKLHVVGDAIVTGDSMADAFKPAATGEPIKFKNFASTELARITNAGNLLIGTTSSFGDKLSVNGNLRLTSATLTGSGFIDNESTYIGLRSVGGKNIVLNSGGTGVGIGTTSPNEALEVAGNIRLTFGTQRQIALGYGTGIRADANTDFLTSFGFANTATLQGQRGFKWQNDSGSVEHMRLLHNGNLLIGTTTDSGNKLDVTGDVLVQNSSAPNFKIYRSGTGQLWNMQIDSSGRLQIKEAASLGGTQHTRLQIDDSGEVEVFNTLTATQYIYLGDTGDTVNFSIRNESNFATISNDTRTLNFIGGDKIFLNGSFSEAMRIKSSGNVLIGTTSDNGDKLRVESDNPIILIKDNNSTIRYAAINFNTNGGNWFLSTGDSNTGAGVANSDLWITRDKTGSDNRFRFHRDHKAFSIYSGSNQNVKLNADGSSYFNGGNVLIGTTTDSGEKLQVNGNIQIVTGEALYLGNGNNMGIYHNGTNTFIENATGNLEIINHTNDGDIIFKSDDGSGGITEYLRLDGGNSRVEFSKNLKIIDNVYLLVGNGNDLQLLHNTIQSFIINETGDLTIRQNANDKDIIFECDNSSGGVATYFKLDGSEVLNRFFVNVLHQDSVESMWGTGLDLKIKHDGSNSFIRNFTGDLYIRNAADDKDIIFQSDDGSGGVTTYFKLDGSVTQTIFEKNVRFLDTIELRLGTSNDLRIYHNGTNSNIENFNGTLQIVQTVDDEDIVFRCDDGSGGHTPYITLDGSAGQIHLQKTVGVGTTNPDTAYKIDIAGKAQVQDVLELDNVLTLNAISTPPNPDEGKSSIYMDSADGNIKVKINIEGTVVTRTIATFE